MTKKFFLPARRWECVDSIKVFIDIFIGIWAFVLGYIWNRAQTEPLLPIEKKLIGWSLGIGIVLLVALALLNHFAPATF